MFKNSKAKKWISLVLAVAFFFNTCCPTYARDGNSGDKEEWEIAGLSFLSGFVTAIAICAGGVTAMWGGFLGSVASDLVGLYMYYNEYEQYGKPMFKVGDVTITRGSFYSMVAGVVAGAIGGFAAGAATGAKVTVKTVIESIIKGILNFPKDFVMGMFKMIKSIFDSLMQLLRQLKEAFATFAKEASGGLLRALGHLLVNIGNSLLNFVKNLIRTYAGKDVSKTTPSGNSVTTSDPAGELGDGSSLADSANLGTTQGTPEPNPADPAGEMNVGNAAPASPATNPGPVNEISTPNPPGTDGNAVADSPGAAPATPGTNSGMALGTESNPADTAGEMDVGNAAPASPAANPGPVNEISESNPPETDGNAVSDNPGAAPASPATNPGTTQGTQEPNPADPAGEMNVGNSPPKDSIVSSGPMTEKKSLWDKITHPLESLKEWKNDLVKHSKEINNPYFLAGTKLDFGALFSQITRDLIVGTVKLVVSEWVRQKLEEAGYDHAIAAIAGSLAGMVAGAFVTPFASMLVGAAAIANNGGLLFKRMKVKDASGKDITVEELIKTMQQAGDTKVGFIVDGKKGTPEEGKRIFAPGNEAPSGYGNATPVTAASLEMHCMVLNPDGTPSDKSLGGYLSSSPTETEGMKVVFAPDKNNTFDLTSSFHGDLQTAMVGYTQLLMNYGWILGCTGGLMYTNQGTPVLNLGAFQAGWVAVTHLGFAPFVRAGLEILVLWLTDYKTNHSGDDKKDEFWKMLLAEGVGNIGAAFVNKLDLFGKTSLANGHPEPPYSQMGQESTGQYMAKVVVGEAASAGFKGAWKQMLVNNDISSSAITDLGGLMVSSAASGTVDALWRQRKFYKDENNYGHYATEEEYEENKKNQGDEKKEYTWEKLPLTAPGVLRGISRNFNNNLLQAMFGSMLLPENLYISPFAKNAFTGWWSVQDKYRQNIATIWLGGHPWDAEGRRLGQNLEFAMGSNFADSVSSAVTNPLMSPENRSYAVFGPTTQVLIKILEIERNAAQKELDKFGAEQKKLDELKADAWLERQDKRFMEYAVTIKQVYKTDAERDAAMREVMKAYGVQPPTTPAMKGPGQAQGQINSEGVPGSVPAGAQPQKKSPAPSVITYDSEGHQWLPDDLPGRITITKPSSVVGDKAYKILNGIEYRIPDNRLKDFGLKKDDQGKISQMEGVTYTLPTHISRSGVAADQKPNPAPPVSSTPNGPGQEQQTQPQPPTVPLKIQSADQVPAGQDAATNAPPMADADKKPGEAAPVPPVQVNPAQAQSQQQVGKDGAHSAGMGGEVTMAESEKGKAAKLPQGSPGTGGAAASVVRRAFGKQEFLQAEVNRLNEVIESLQSQVGQKKELRVFGTPIQALQSAGHRLQARRDEVDKDKERKLGELKGYQEQIQQSGQDEKGIKRTAGIIEKLAGEITSLDKKKDHLDWQIGRLDAKADHLQALQQGINDRHGKTISRLLETGLDIPVLGAMVQAGYYGGMALEKKGYVDLNDMIRDGIVDYRVKEARSDYGATTVTISSSSANAPQPTEEMLMDRATTRYLATDRNQFGRQTESNGFMIGSLNAEKTVAIPLVTTRYFPITNAASVDVVVSGQAGGDQAPAGINGETQGGSVPSDSSKKDEKAGKINFKTNIDIPLYSAGDNPYKAAPAKLTVHAEETSPGEYYTYTVMSKNNNFGTTKSYPLRVWDMQEQSGKLRVTDYTTDGIDVAKTLEKQARDYSRGEHGAENVGTMTADGQTFVEVEGEDNLYMVGQTAVGSTAQGDSAGKTQWKKERALLVPTPISKNEIDADKEFLYNEAGSINRAPRSGAPEVDPRIWFVSSPQASGVAIDKITPMTFIHKRTGEKLTVPVTIGPGGKPQVKIGDETYDLIDRNTVRRAGSPSSPEIPIYIPVQNVMEPRLNVQAPPTSLFPEHATDVPLDPAMSVPPERATGDTPKLPTKGPEPLQPENVSPATPLAPQPAIPLKVSSDADAASSIVVPPPVPSAQVVPSLRPNSQEVAVSNPDLVTLPAVTSAKEPNEVTIYDRTGVIPLDTFPVSKDGEVALQPGENRGKKGIIFDADDEGKLIPRDGQEVRIDFPVDKNFDVKGEVLVSGTIIDGKVTFPQDADIKGNNGILYRITYSEDSPPSLVPNAGKQPSLLFEYENAVVDRSVELEGDTPVVHFKFSDSTPWANDFYDIVKDDASKCGIRLEPKKQEPNVSESLSQNPEIGYNNNYERQIAMDKAFNVHSENNPI